MKNPLTLAALVVLAATSSHAQSNVSPRAGVDWPSFRGIASAGVDQSANLPVE